MVRLTVLSVTVALIGATTALAQTGVPGAHFIENWDLDGDGQVTRAEATEKRGDIFTMFDQDENESLDSTEYDLFDETRKADMEENAGGHGKGPMKHVNAGMMRAANDVDGDGEVTRDEFMSRTDAWFDKKDRSGDGVVTTEDFRRGG